MSATESVRRLYRAGMRRTARDLTARAAGRSAVVLAPHPDDETLGCGATILRKVAAGTQVTVVVITDGRHSHRSPHLSADELATLRRGEMDEAARRLGLTPAAVRWAGFIDGTLKDHEDEVYGSVAAILEELAPDEVYATSAQEPHPDHAAVGRAARRAVAARPKTQLLEYPVWLWGTWPLRRGERLGSTVDATGMLLGRRMAKVRAGEHLTGKMHALRAHASQLRRPEGVPLEEEWAVLPPAVIDAAGAPAELFIPYRTR